MCVSQNRQILISRMGISRTVEQMYGASKLLFEQVIIVIAMIGSVECLSIMVFTIDLIGHSLILM